MTRSAPAPADARETELVRAIDAWPAPDRATGHALRALILRIAAETSEETPDDTPAIGPLRETLAWGQPAWRPVRAGIGTTLRLGPARKSDPRLALMVPCRTTLVREMRMIAPEGLEFDGDRGLFLPPDATDDANVADFIRSALRYHVR